MEEKSINTMNNIDITSIICNINNTHNINTQNIKTRDLSLNHAKKSGEKRKVKCYNKQGNSTKIQRILQKKLHKQIKQNRKTNFRLLGGKKIIMVNEGKTEFIVRDHFMSDPLYKKKELTIEPKQSDNLRIKKLLKNASKIGGGNGYPDFIISVKNEFNFLIVIECKADIRKHQSNNLDKYSEYAVDGVLLYSSYLSKEFDVLSIAVSGEGKNEIKVSHFLQLMGEDKPRKIFGKDLLSIESYLNGYKQDEKKFKQSYNDLLKYSKELNDFLHSKKVKESDRSLLISGILIALDDEQFKAGYEKQKNPKSLAENLVKTIEQQLSSNLSKEKADTLIHQYSFIEIHPILSKNTEEHEDVLKKLIKNIDQNINSFMKTYQYHDVLGQFYIEFLKYANDDKGLGIVLTPPHITELFSEIANVGKNDVILDNCCGTGGFLISAMQKMILDAEGDIKKIKEIKRNQLIGIEQQPTIFALACSNMYIHGDGKSNVYYGSCFDEETINLIKKNFKPTIGFLNPPYKSTKIDKEELEFVLNNLSLLEKGSLCIAIIPMSCALAQKGIGLELKRKLLKENTLKAVFSMPPELFHNSNVGVNTCVVVFRAKEKHPDNYKTYFGYWKDDGFVKRRAGRGDYNHKWDKIKKEWLNNYKNKEEIIGHSIKKNVSAEDEWCVEAYMQTDYSRLNEEDFKKIIKEFVAFKFMNKED
jgi:16S rRNA G966 N2-methylase RsmD